MEEQKVFKHSYKTPHREPAGLTVYNCGSQRCTPGYQWGPGIRDHYLIHYIISGAGTYNCEGSRFNLKAGDAFLVRPDRNIMYRADEDRPWHYAWVGFSGPDASYLLSRTAFTELMPVIHPEDGAAIQTAFKDVWRVRGTSYRHSISLTGALYTALSLFLDENNRNNGGSGYYKMAVDYIRKNYATYGLTIEEIADYIGINRSYLFEVFKDASGNSPKEYLTQFRISQASILLLDSDLPISNIAASVGFEDSFYFSKVFKKLTGHSPRSFREKRRSTIDSKD
ncbi:MAG: AraC family transcriptional regulator [Eubacteriaceae bacterium]|jgi:AraC-like DNA-binding protein